MEILNHREMEYETKKLFTAHNIDIENNIYWFDESDTKAIELMEWLNDTAKEVTIRDIELDYGLDCIRGYLMFEKVPKANDLDMDTWDEGSLEGVYKFICKYYRAMNTIYHANKTGYYKDLDLKEVFRTLDETKINILKYINRENTLANRHNIMAALMNALNVISKKCNVGQLTVKHHDEEIAHAVAGAGNAMEEENDSLANEEITDMCKKYMLMVSAFIPYITEQCWKLYSSEGLAIEEKF